MSPLYSSSSFIHAGGLQESVTQVHLYIIGSRFLQLIYTCWRISGICNPSSFIHTWVTPPAHLYKLEDFRNLQPKFIYTYLGHTPSSFIHAGGFLFVVQVHLYILGLLPQLIYTCWGISATMKISVHLYILK